MNAVTFRSFNVDTRAECLVTFEGHRCERRALRWMDRRAATHAFGPDEDYPPPRWARRLWDRLYPLCHHGLSLDLCYDPINHYPRDDDFY